MTRRMLRYEVPVDDQRHVRELKAGAAIVLVAATPHVVNRVEFWAESDMDEMWEPVGPVEARTFQVFGTGHPLPDDAVWRGTADRTPQGLVWHLFELPRSVTGQPSESGGTS